MTFTRDKALKKKRVAIFRRLLAFRMVTLIPIIFMLVGVIILFIVGSIHIFQSMSLLLEYGFNPETAILVPVVKAIDFYIVGIALMLLTFGFYDLTIEKVRFDSDQVNERLPDLLRDIGDMDQVKKKFISVIVIALMVFAFEFILSLKIENQTDLLQFSGSVFLLACAGAVTISGKEKQIRENDS